VLTDKSDAKSATSTVLTPLEQQFFGTQPARPEKVVPLFTPSPVDPRTANLMRTIGKQVKTTKIPKLKTDR
jgi:hypothetical protein